MSSEFAWGLDVARLRLTLDRLRAALDPPVPVSFGASLASLGHDRERVLLSLRQITDLLGHVDLEARHALSGIVTPSSDAGDSERLHGILVALHQAWRTLVLDKLDEETVRCLRELLEPDPPDLLGLLGREDDENVHSDVLRCLLDPKTAPSVGPSSLVALTRFLDTSNEWEHAIRSALASHCLSVRREYVIGREWDGDENLARIDLVVSGPGFVLAIENKIWSVEHERQTECYWEWLARLPGLKAGLFLTPTGHQAGCPAFKPVSYLDLVGCLLKGPTRGRLRTEERVILSAYLKTLAEHVLRAELRAARTLEV